MNVPTITPPVARQPVLGLLPLADRILIGHSPGSPEGNHHVDPRVPQQRFAYDILSVDRDGRLFIGDNKQLTSWVGYGKPIFSPFAGEVVSAVDGWKELVPMTDPGKDAEALQNPSGNHVVIKLDDGNFAFLAHMKKGSVEKSLLGKRIEVGTVVGELGNSGNTTMPHLHVHVATTPEHYGANSVGVPLAFSGYQRLGAYTVSPEKGFTDWNSSPKNVAVPTVPLQGEVITTDMATATEF